MLTRVLLSLLILSVPPALSAGEFPNGPGDPTCPDNFATGAIFKITFLDGSPPQTVTVIDQHTIIGRSNPHEEGDLADQGAEVCDGGSASYPNTLQFVPDACTKPARWQESPDTRREVHTQILAFNLSGALPAGSIHIRAGQSFYNSVAGTARERLYRNSIGEVASEYDGYPPDYSKDFDAKAYFNVFVEVEINIPPVVHYLYNKTAMVLLSTLTQFPPIFQLPQSTYIHDPNFGPVALYDASGKLVAWLSSAGHGSPAGKEDAPDPPKSLPFECPVSFAVDFTSVGLDPFTSGVSPNDVFLYRGTLGLPLTGFVSASNGVSRPNMSNKRWLEPLLAAYPPGTSFDPGDAINSYSYGEDGSRDNNCLPYDAGFYFSVTRSSQGDFCSDVYPQANPLLPVGEAAADIFASRTPPFGMYQSPGGIHPPVNDNVLAVDNVNLGLSPLDPFIEGATEDDVTALELDIAPPQGDFLYATFTGPSFAGNTATIYLYNVEPLDNPFAFSNLIQFAPALSMGLQSDDVIDALVLSDIGPNGVCPSHPNLFMDPDEDEVLFSLAPGSPSLQGGMFSAADIFYSDFDGTFTLYAGHAQLGLLFTDDVDAADIKTLPEPELMCELTECVTDVCAVTATQGLEFRHDVCFSGGRFPFVFTSLTDLPPGVHLEQNTGSLVGIPTEATEPDFYPIHIQVTDADGRTEQTQIELTVMDNMAISYNTPNYVLAGSDFGLAPAGGDSAIFTLVGGSLPPGLNLSVDGVIAGVVGGEYGYKATITAANGTGVAYAKVVFVVERPLVLDYPDFTTVEAGLDVSIMPQVSGGAPPYSFTLIGGSLPNMLLLDPANGHISGLAVQSGTFTAVVEVADSDGNSTDDMLSIEVVNSNPLTFSYDSPQTVDENEVVGLDPQVSGGTPPYTYYLLGGSLPPLLVLDNTSGVIEGTATQEGVYSSLIGVVDDFGEQAEADLLITVLTPPKPTSVGETGDPIDARGYPNPAGDNGAAVEYEVEAASMVELSLYDNLGNKLRSLVKERQEAGEYTVKVNTADLAPGLYHYRLRIGESMRVINLVVIRR